MASQFLKNYEAKDKESGKEIRKFFRQYLIECAFEIHEKLNLKDDSLSIFKFLKPKNVFKIKFHEDMTNLNDVFHNFPNLFPKDVSPQKIDFEWHKLLELDENTKKELLKKKKMWLNFGIICTILQTKIMRIHLLILLN